MLVVGLSHPTVGGYVTEYYGWHTVFFILCMNCNFDCRTMNFDHSISLKPKPIISNFISIVKEPQFYTMLLRVQLHFPVCLPMSCFSYFIHGYFKIDAKTYGWIFAFVTKFIGSSQLNCFIKRFSSEQMI
jgi:DHA1 family bicyclomycin/chloramphenicol resistance-like MFS transporter